MLKRFLELAYSELVFFTKFFDASAASTTENVADNPPFAFATLLEPAIKGFYAWLDSQLHTLADPLSALLALKLVLALSDHYQHHLLVTERFHGAGEIFEKCLLQLQFLLKPKCHALLSLVIEHLNNHSVFSLHLNEASLTTIFPVCNILVFNTIPIA